MARVKKHSTEARETGTHAIWSGTISFVLVNIPVRLYPAVQYKELSFVLLHKKDNSRIHYARICAKEGKEVPYEDIVKGFEYSKGKYVIVSDEDFEKADPKRSQSIEILDFVDETQIDPIYFDHPYFLEPGKGAEQAFTLFFTALQKTEKVALAKFVLREREHLVILKPYNGALLLQQLRFAHEIRRPAPVAEIGKEHISKKELDIAIELINKLSGSFEPSHYKDTYYDTLMDIIARKAKGQLIQPASEKPLPTKFKDLMAALKESLQKHHKKLVSRKKAPARARTAY